MKPYVVSSRAASVRVRHSGLVIDDYFNRTRQEFPPHELPFDLLIVSNTTGNLSLSAINFLLRHEVPVLILDWNGRPSGSLLPPRPMSGELQLAQLRAFDDPAIRRLVASKFLDEKFAKSVQLLTHLKQYYPGIDLGEIATEVARPPPSRVQNIYGTLMTKEARVAVAYFRQIAKVIQVLAPEFKFKSRGQSCTSNNMSASDQFNVALNVAYGILECRVRAEVNKAGPVESVGFLHEAQPGALPCVCDMMEPFRWLADYSLVRLLERKLLRREDFLITLDFDVRRLSIVSRVVAYESVFQWVRPVASVV